MKARAAHAVAPLEPDALAALQAIAEPNRVRIIALLGHGEHCVCDAGEVLGMSPALISHHLRALRATGLIRERRSGRWVYYSLDLERLAGFRAVVTRLLDPSDVAAATCLCSDCGTSRLPVGRTALMQVSVLNGVGS